MRIKDFMKKPVVIEKDIFLSDAAKIMTKNSISSLIIERDGKILGIITHKDLISHFGESIKVFEIMTKKVISIKEDDKIERAIELAKDKELGIFPVTDSKDRLVGVFDSKDLLKVWDNDDFLID